MTFVLFFLKSGLPLFRKEEEQRNERASGQGPEARDMELAPTMRGRTGFDGGVEVGTAGGCA